MFMSSRRPVRQLVVAILFGVLVGGGLMAVTPAGAEVSQAVATNWKKIWKKNLKPLADRRYYTKAQSDTRYQPKGSYDTAGAAAAAQAAANAATDTKLGGYYKKSESDAKYAPMPGLIRGSYGLQVAPNTGALAVSVSFGVTLSAPPTVHYITLGSPVPDGCAGTLAAPGANPGHMCIFESGSSNVSGQQTISGAASGAADPFGLFILGTQTSSASVSWFRDTWAVRPAAPVTAAAGGGAPAEAHSNNSLAD
jgi:hypothetical protein